MAIEQADQTLAGEVLGITDPHNYQEAFRQAAQTLGYPLLHPIFMRAISPDTTSPELCETRVDTLAVSEILVGEVNRASTLIDWLTYRRIMETHGTKGDGTATALMIGSLSAISSRSFVCLAKNEYGADKAHIIDPVETPVKATHGIFQRGSGLDLPYDSGSMDFVHTNRLLHMLQDPSSPTAPHDYMLRSLMQEVKRVLKPGGQLLMNERLIEYDEDMPIKDLLRQAHSLGQTILDSLKRSDMSTVFVHAGIMPRDPGFLFTPQRELSECAFDLTLASLSVYAQKRPHRTFAL